MLSDQWREVLNAVLVFAATAATVWIREWWKARRRDDDEEDERDDDWE